MKTNNKLIEEYLKYLIKWIKIYVKQANAKGVVLGVSGGIDSALVSYLVKQSFPNNHIVLSLICESNKLFKNNINALVKKFNLNFLEINLNKPFKVLKKSLCIKNDKSKENLKIIGNIKARLRMLSLYYYAQKNNYLVLGTDNASEWYTGYFTKYGDGGVDLLPIVHLSKQQVRAAAQLVAIPKNIINIKPSADLWEGQTDEKELGLKYDIIDAYLNDLTITTLDKAKIVKLHNSSDHKRKPIPQPKSLHEFEKKF